ncbi:HigA family addiction module antitoxin [Adhaeribacter pallidiroseus]|uniref:Virulence-associated protein A n=1 Tax=Adhaeribacter pallidiroseus TaxID=2072847 RepID=A0A369QFC8_9BACT|nr:HigA family addiction module antitoxin [Adhaeribacter pallidiroseus]RDC63621.1 Virulence-associated protein A' [Adhaeribacter pallidiroseus]
MNMMMHNPPHPGEILREYINGLNKTVTEVAAALESSRKHLSLILNGHTGISTKMARKLSVAFSTTPEFWLNLQKNYELWQARQKVDVSKICYFLDIGS